MSRNYYLGKNKRNPTPLNTKIRAQLMFLFALAVAFAAVLIKNPV